MRTLLLAALVSMASYATAANSASYVVVAPSKYTANMDMTISVNIIKASIPVTVVAELDGKASASGTFEQGKPGSLTLKIPSDAPVNSQLIIKGSGGLTFQKSSSLSRKGKQFSMFIQTNKGTYKPGDTVKFRALSVKSDLSVLNEPMDVLIYDPEGNRIKQWLATTPDQGVITKELQLSSQPVLGNWKIKVQKGGKTAEKEFVVAEYVLPKFEVTVDMPSYAVTSDSDVTFTVKSKYTYGKPVKGQVDVSAKLHFSYETYETSRTVAIFNTKVPLDGEAKVSIPMSTLTRISANLKGRSLTVVANVTEGLTGNRMSGNGTVDLYDQPFKMEFPKSNPNTFKPGLDYTAYLLLSQPDGQPYGNGQETVQVESTVTSNDPNAPKPTVPWETQRTITTKLAPQTFTVGVNGLVEIPINPSLDAVSIKTTAKYNGVSKQLSLKKSYSPSDSYMQLVKTTTGTPQSGDSVSFQLRSTQAVNSFAYQIMSRGSVVETKGLSAGGQKTYDFSITVTGSMAPNARIVGYYVRDDGEIVTDSIAFDVSGVFKNKVTVGVNQAKAEPGQSVDVTVTSDPFSQAHLLAVDQSVLLLRSGNDITPSDVNAELEGYDTVATKDQPVRPFWWGGTVTYSGKDAKEVFNSAGVKVLTDGLIYEYIDPHCPRSRRRCWRHWRRWYSRNSRGRRPFGRSGRRNRRMPNSFPTRRSDGPRFSRFRSRASRFNFHRLSFRRRKMSLKRRKKPKRPSIKSEDLKKPQRLRVQFSESWIWEPVQVRASGSASISSQVPDTITSWVVSAFAVNNQTGFGVAPSTAKLEVFRPFFVSLNLPYSVTRGEQLVLQGIVFNYMNTDMQVRVTLSKSDNFYNIFVDSSGQESYKQETTYQDVMVKAGEAKSVYFPIVAVDLGKIDIEVKAQAPNAADAVRRQLLVEAEGVPKEYSVPVLVELTGGKTSFSKTVDLTVPATIVAGSELTRVTAIGDMMGPSIAGLDSLLKMPTGCGEQTMLGLAPDVYVTDYLKAVNQLDGQIAEKALRYMESGYQRELTYKHTDHSFSAFGNRDGSGSMWLTAFVSRVFHQARSHVDIDENVIKRAINWMVSKQNADGSFPEPGRVIHREMQGGTAGGISLSLFVLISLLENKDLYTGTGTEATKFTAATNKAIQYLANKVDGSDDIYAQALAAYAFTLANSNKAQSVLDKVEAKAIMQDGLKHWHVPEPAKSTASSRGSWTRPHSVRAVDTEITAYILLTYAAKKDLVKGKSVMQWIAQQRNPRGGFSSTQDTVVALNALAEFAKLTYSNNFNVQINAQLNSTLAYNFNVDSTNSLVLQSRETKSIPAQVKVDATGSGMALVQVDVFFNVESEVEDQTFDLTVTLLEDTLNRLTIRTCTRWLGDGAASGMTVQEVGIPSGFDVDSETIPTHSLLKRFEFQNKKLVLYFDEINTQELCLDFVAERTGLVAKSQPAAVRIYDYYEPDNQMTAFYQSQTLKSSNVCDVCPDCDNTNCAKRR